MESAAPSTLIDFESVLSEVSLSTLLQLPAPRELSESDQELAPESPPALRALVLVKSQHIRAALIRRCEFASRCSKASNDLVMEIRARRAQLFAMDQHNALAQVRVPTSLFEPDAEKITPNQRRQEQIKRRLKNRVIYAVPNRGWTPEGLAFFGGDFIIRGEAPLAAANLYLDVEEYFGIECAGDALIVYEIAKETWRIRRLNEAAHQILLMKFEAIARKYLAQDIHSPGEDSRATTSIEDRASSLIRELVAAGSGPNVVLAEVLQHVAPILDDIDLEIERAYARRLDYCRRLTRLRGKKLRTELHHIRGAGYRNRGEWESQ
jgi:hypothetical protein